MWRRAGWVAIALLVVATPWAFAYGPLFPWSAIKPGYSKVSFKRADFYRPQGRVPDPAYLRLDDYIAQAESFHGLAMPYRVRVIAPANWDDFSRFAPFAPGRAVAGVTLDTGTVIYISPKIAERGLDHGEFLRHELSHAIVAQNVSFLRLFKLHHYTWLYEGVPVWFGRQRAFLPQEEFLSRAKNVELQPYFDFDAYASHVREIDMRFAYIAWRDFLDYLSQQRGKETFNLFFKAVQREPDRITELFTRSYGYTLNDAVSEFQHSIHEGTYRPGEPID